MLVERRSVTLPEPLPLACGRDLAPCTLAYEVYGPPAAAGVVLVCHSLTRDAHAAGRHAPGAPSGWWDLAIGPGKMLDTRRYRVICSNVLGGCGGSTGPATVDPATGHPFGARFPVVTIGDMVRAQKRLLDLLGVRRLAAVIGGCLGGQQALEWAILYPEMVERVIAISVTPATSAHTIATFGVMRRMIRDDPAWHGGDYYGRAFPVAGMAHALSMALPLWMTREAMQKRFGRRLAHTYGYAYSLEPEFEVEAFVAKVARRVSERFDANSLLYLTRAEEYFDLEREHGSLAAAVRSIRSRVLLVGYRSDWRYPPRESEPLLAALRGAGVDAHSLVLDSLYGHGAFQLELGGLDAAVGGFLAAGAAPPAETACCRPGGEA